MKEKELPEITQPTNNTQNLIITFIAIIMTALVAGMAVYIWQISQIASTEKELQQKIALLEKQLASLPTSSEQATDQTPSPTQENANQNQPISSLTSIDETWNLYTNYQYGFSLKIPKVMSHSYGSMCDWTNDSYRPKTGNVPVKVFEEEESIFISSDFFYNLAGETVKNNVHYYTECNKIINSISNLKNDQYFQQQSWQIVIKNIHNNTELENFIKERYGQGCKLGDQAAAHQSGVFDVSIKGDGKDLSETECPLNYMTVLKYYPQKNIAVSWHLGQALTFSFNNQIYDQEMLNSFKFE